MAHNRQRVDKDTFKQIFRDHWGPFQQRHPRYQDRHVQAVIDKRLGCGTLEAGYTTYLCPHCLEEKRVAFSCKSSFCLSCCKVYVDERSEEHTSELQSPCNLVCRLLLEKKKYVAQHPCRA